MKAKGKYRRTTRFTLACIAILLGLGWSRMAEPLPASYVWILAVFALMTFRKARIISVYSLIALGFSLGWWRGGIFMQNVRDFQALSKETVRIVGTANTDAVYDDRSQLSFDMSGLSLVEPYEHKLVGKIGVAGFGEAMVYRGDRVEVVGKFYPTRGSRVANISFAQVNVQARSNSAVYSITRNFAAGLQNALPEPLASFALGLLVGQRNSLPESVANNLSAVGLTHIIAVSGYNLTIMVRAGRRAFGKRSKFQTLFGSLVLIASFLLITGMSPSIVRAAIISGLSLGAWFYGRNFKPLFLILFTASVTAMWNPLYIWSDIGWYLSFLAFFGILILSPLLRTRFRSRKEKGLIGLILLETLSAQIMTMPLILYIFGTSSYVAIIANILVVPLIPLAMLLSFIAGTAGMMIPTLAGWLAWPARLILTYQIDIATMFARLPGVQFTAEVSMGAMIIMYLSLISVMFVMWRKQPKVAIITEVNNPKEINVRSLQMVNN